MGLPFKSLTLLYYSNFNLGEITLKILARREDNPQGLPPSTVIRTLKRKYEYDVDEYYGYLFQIPQEDVQDVSDYLAKHQFHLVDDPDNDDWYFLEITE